MKKTYMRRLFTVALLTMFSLGAWADQKIRVNITGSGTVAVSVGGLSITLDQNGVGTVTGEAGQEVTLTVTPESGCKVTNFTVQKTVIASSRSGESVGAGAISYTVSGSTYSFTMPEDDYDANVNVGFGDSLEGFYLIQNHNNNQTFYLCVSHRNYNNDASTPYLRTKQGPAENEVWELRLDGTENGVNFYNIIHHADGKYVVANGNSGAKVVHLETITDISALTPERRNAIRFRISAGGSNYITATHTAYAIMPYGVNYNSGQSNSFNPYSGNGNGNDGDIGLWRYNDDPSSNWHLIETAAPPFISYDSAGKTFSISYPENINEGITIHYTTDGSTPTASSPTYEGSTIDANTVFQVRAIAVKGSCPDKYYIADFFSPLIPFAIQHQWNTDYYSIPSYADNSGNIVILTTSLPRPNMAWRYEDAGLINGVRFYYIKNVELGLYVHCPAVNGNFRLRPNGEFDSNAAEYKFRPLYDEGKGFRIITGANTSFWLWKDNNNDPNKLWSRSNSADRDGKHYWNLVPLNGPTPRESLTLPMLPFTLSTDACASYVRIKNANTETSSYYIVPSTESSQFANTSDAGNIDDRWYIREVAHDDWLTYYSIINASTGRCLSFRGNISGTDQNDAFETVMLTASEMATSERAQFALARGKNDDASDEEYYYIVPRSIRYENDGKNYTVIRRDNSNPLKTQSTRGDWNRKWIFKNDSFTCKAPEFNYNSEQGTILLSSPNNAPIYYIGYNDGDPEPALSPESGTLYSAPFDALYNRYKAIASRCTDGSDKSSEAIYIIDGGFRCVRPIISYDSSTKLVTISCATATATIYYTTDGEDPTLSSIQYTRPFLLEEPRIIKAIAIRGTEEATASLVAIYNKVPTYIDSSSEITDWQLTYAANPGFTVDTDEPIGTVDNPFTGSFDGAYVPIDLDHPLFGYVDGATIKNVSIKNASVNTSGNVGALVNETKGETRIYNCGVLGGNVTSTTGAAGGLVGHIVTGSKVRVVNCFNYADVSGSTRAAGIVGLNDGTVGDVRIAMCMMYGKLTSGTVKSPVYTGNHTSNNKDYTEYNYWRSRAYTRGETAYTVYNDQLAIDKDEFLTRFPFYRHILNTHRELAAFFLFQDSKISDVGSARVPTGDEVAEIGHWVLKRGDDAPKYPVIETWLTNTKRTTEDINNNLPSTTTTDRFAGKLLTSIGGDNCYNTSGDKITEMGSGGYLTVTVRINGSEYTSQLPITDMDTLRYDFTWGKVVLPYVSEYSGWTRDYSKICTGWKIVEAGGASSFNIPSEEPYNFADRGNAAKDIYNPTSNPYIFAQGGNYIVPYGVSAITIEANFAKAFYLSDRYGDFGYNNSYGEQTNLGWEVPDTYHGQPVYTDLSTLVGRLSNSTNPHSQAIVLVGNYHYNQNTVGQKPLNTDKACSIMSIDEDNNQEPDYGWYSYHTWDRTEIPPMRFDFVPNIGIGMAARVTNSTPNPTIGIWHSKGWFELTETALSFMSECEINSSKFTSLDNSYGNNRWIANSGYFIQIVRCRQSDCNRLSYIQIGGNAYVEELYPGSHTDNANITTLRPIIVNGGEIEECYMTGYRAGATATGSNIYFWSAGGKMHKWLGAYMENPSTVGVNVTAKIDHARILRFFGGGTSSSARITGNIDITMNNSLVDFYCGGPEFGDMESGKTVTTHSTGSTFIEYYGAGFGGTSITYNREGNNTSVSFGNATVNYPLGWSSFKRLTANDNYGIGVNYKFEYILYAGGGGTGVARFYTGYALFSLATTGNVNNYLTGCTIQNDFYGAGCQGMVSGDVTSTLTDCTIKGDVYGGGFKATSNEVKVYPTTQPDYSVYTKETGLFSEFGTTEPEIWTWEQGTSDKPSLKDGEKVLLTSKNITMANLGNVDGAITLNVEEGTTVDGSVFGGGNESKSLKNATVNIKGGTVINNVYGGGNVADVGGSTQVNVTGGTVKRDVFGGGYGKVTNIGGDVTVNIGAKTGDATYSGTGDIQGSVYGGSALGTVNTSTNNKTTVNLYQGTIHGDAYGGGLGQIGCQATETEPDIIAVKAMVKGNVEVNQYGVKYEISTMKENEDDEDEIVNSGRIFGCNNQNGSPLGSVDVNVYSTKPYSGDRAKGKYEIAAVYGGGNLAAYEPYGPQANGTAEDFKATTHFAHVTINGCDNVSIQQVYGGGNAASTPSTQVDVLGSYEIEEVFGGGNGMDRILKSGTWMDNPGANVGFYEYDDNVEGRTDTKENRASYYGYGTGAANVNIKGGQIHRVFGGSNTKGNVRITAVTMLEDDNSCTFFKIDEAYGGGKSAPMDAEAKLLMACIPGLSAAYGGAEAADVQGGVTLSITNGTFDRVFGGNNISGTIGGPIVVNIEETGCKPIIIGELYGGGNKAPYSVYGYNDDRTPKTSGDKVYPDPVVNVKSFTSIGNIYGGGYGETAVMYGDPTVNVNVVEGNWKDKVADESDTDYNTPGYMYDATGYKGTTKEIDGENVVIPPHGKGKIGVINNVFGGGNAAPVEGSTHVNIGTTNSETYVTGDNASHEVKGVDIRGNVYGGGNKAEVTGNTNVVVGKSSE